MNSTSRPLNPSAGVPFFDLRRQTAAIHEELLAAIESVCSSGHFILGPECERFERSFAEFCGVPHAVSCASGSDALLLALMAKGVKNGDEVLVPAYSFFSPAGAVARLGARPVFVDIDPVSYTIDPGSAEKAVSKRTKAIIPVHLFGQSCEMGSIQALADKFGLTVIEDSAQAIGASYAGVRVGGLGDVGCFSFFPTKNLGCFGDGGMLTTKDGDLAKQLRTLRVHGMQRRYHHEMIGINSRLDALQAAILHVKLRHLDVWTNSRTALATRYSEEFRRHGVDRWLELPRVAVHRTHVWNQYVVRVPGGHRDRLRSHLSQLQIGTEVYYPEPLHTQPCFTHLSPADRDCRQSEHAAAETLALPVFPELTFAEQSAVIDGVTEYRDSVDL